MGKYLSPHSPTHHLRVRPRVVHARGVGSGCRARNNATTKYEPMRGLAKMLQTSHDVSLFYFSVWPHEPDGSRRRFFLQFVSNSKPSTRRNVCSYLTSRIIPRGCKAPCSASERGVLGGSFFSFSICCGRGRLNNTILKGGNQTKNVGYLSPEPFETHG